MADRITLLRQRTVLADFGIAAFRAVEIPQILQHGLEQICNGLQVKNAAILQRKEDKLQTIATKGWSPDIIGREEILTTNTPAGNTLISDVATITDNILSDKRFHSKQERFKNYGIKSVIDVPILGKNGPFGILEVCSKIEHHFTKEDISFLNSYANLLGAAIDRIQIEHELNKVIKHKNILFAELQHRVKNNLQVIIAMMGIHRRAISTDFDIITGRIEALRIIYAKLYLTNHKGMIPFDEYIKELCESLIQFSISDHGKIDLNIFCTEILVDIDTATPLGLIATEFIINSMKHAFKNAGTGTISVNLSTLDGDKKGKLILKDDGLGIPKGVLDGTLGRGSGLNLINQLAQQADAELVWDTDHSTRLTVIFPIIRDGHNDTPASG
ncbi:MAG TPA: histidine kinase dimerization/phosphoacceptor domain -containing protein [Methylomirabilota bacterium]|nr:histidine kinase dimerization/phosphoacceptor domain -containing protein [Methylomirabilota bacterium]